MAKALSLDLRSRVLAAIAGDLRVAGPIEMHAELILALVEGTPDMTLDELRAAGPDQAITSTL